MIQHEINQLKSIKELSIKGRIDSITSQEIEKIINELTDSGERTFAINLAEVNYISSAGLRVFLNAQKTLKKAGGELIMWSLTPQVKDIFKMGGLNRLFQIFDSQDEYTKSSEDSTDSIEVIKKKIDANKYKILKRKADKGSFSIFGNATKADNSDFSESDLTQIDAAKVDYCAALAAIGQDWEEIKNYFGESVIIKGSLFSYPAMKLPAVDFMLYNDSGMDLKYNLLHGFGINGNFSNIISFESEGKFPVFSEIINDISKLTELDSFGVVFIGESKGFWGMNLRNIPIQENKPANNQAISSDENFANWFNFPVEPSEINDIIVGTGVYSKNHVSSEISKVLSNDNDFHIHCAIFEKMLFDVNLENFEKELSRIIMEAEVKKVQHMLGKSVFNRAIFGIIEL